MIDRTKGQIQFPPPTDGNKGYKVSNAVQNTKFNRVEREKLNKFGVMTRFPKPILDKYEPFHKKDLAKMLLRVGA